jgi:hypothetical protein
MDFKLFFLFGRKNVILGCVITSRVDVLAMKDEIRSCRRNYVLRCLWSEFFPDILLQLSLITPVPIQI